MISQLKKDKYKIEVDIGFDSNGKRQRIFETFYGTKKDAKLREAEIKKNVKFGTYINFNKCTFEELSNKYLDEYVVPNLSEKTICSYKQLSRDINKYIGKVQIKNINTLLLTEFYNKMKTNHNGRELSNNTILHYYNFINSVLKFGVTMQLLPLNVNEKIPRPKVIKKEIKCYTKGETLELINCLNEEPLKYQAIIMLALDSAIRRSELLGLEWSDIDFSENTIHVSKSVVSVDRRIIEKETKNYSSNRVIIITDYTMNILKKYKEEQDLIKTKLGKKWGGSKKIFTTNDGQQMHPDTPSKILAKIIKKYNLKKISFHGLRHTSASLQISLGVHSKLISGRLGHASISTTMDIYSHIFKATEKESANQLDKLFSSSIQ